MEGMFYTLNPMSKGDRFNFGMFAANCSNDKSINKVW